MIRSRRFVVAERGLKVAGVTPAALNDLALVPTPIWATVLLAFGLVTGSFVNVLTWRTPRGLSILGRSRCLACQAKIRWYDNVPVLSFLRLRGRCRACRAPIAWRYPLVEIGTGLLWTLAALRFGAGMQSVVVATFLAWLLTLTLIDLEHMLLPDVLTLTLAANGFLNALAGLGPSLGEVMLAALGGAGVIGAIVVVTRGMGSGDAFLAGAIGANLGLKATVLALWIGMVLGGVVGIALLALRVRSRKDPIPYGPMLAAGAALAAFWTG